MKPWSSRIEHWLLVNIVLRAFIFLDSVGFDMAFCINKITLTPILPQNKVRVQFTLA